MKENGRMMFHPNQENKTGKPTYASSTQRNFSDNDSLPGKKVYMKVLRAKKSNLQSIYNFLKRIVRNLISSMETKK